MQSSARKKINNFIEYVGKDEKGESLVQAEIHKEIQWHIDECIRQEEMNCGILAPWGHGKTEQVAIFRTLKELGRDQNLRIQIICNADDNARSRVSTISEYILDDDEYHKTFPHVVPASRGDWNKHKLVLKRTAKTKDGSVEAWGINTSGTGSRADIQVYDDPVDLRNAILNPAMRQQVKDSFSNVWLSRVAPGGLKIYIATRWHEDDLTTDLLKNGEWKFLIMKISEDFKSIECESPFKGTYKIDLWDYWNEQRLRKQFKLLRERAFNRGYRQRAISDEDRTFPSSEGIFKSGIGLDIIQPHWVRSIGIDPFGKRVVIFVLAFNPLNKRRFVQEIRLGAWQPRRTIREIINAYKTFSPQIIVVENNAAQEAIAQWTSEVGGVDMPIVPFTTGSQKASPTLGLPSVEVEFANDAWVVPYLGVDETDSEHPLNIWRSELRGHPVAAAEDTVMAMWFAREGVRFLTNYVEGEESQDIVTQEDMGVETVQIGAY